MSPKMLIYAGVNLHQWAQPPAKHTPAEWSLSLADKSEAGWVWGVGGGCLPPFSPPAFTSPLLFWSLGLNCWLPRQSIGTAGVIESLLRRSWPQIPRLGEEHTHICTQMRLMFLLSGEDKAWNICLHETHRWVVAPAGLQLFSLLTSVIFISPRSFAGVQKKMSLVVVQGQN